MLAVGPAAWAASGGDSNAGVVWTDNVGQPAGPGHEQDPHLACQNINVWGSGLADSSGAFSVDGWPPSGSQEVDYAAPWSYNQSGGGTQVVAVINVSQLISQAKANGDAPRSKQGYHFMLDFSQDPQKHKTFWVNCPPSTTAPPAGTPPATPPPSTPGFSILKEQRIGGEPFTASTLVGVVGETVQYELIVTNTGNTSLTFSDFTDPRCDAGTIAGGPGTSSLAPGDSTTYTCNHVLTAADKANGSDSNAGTDTGTPPGGPPITIYSNTVIVNLPSTPTPGLSIVKEQRIGNGPFTTGTLPGTVGETVKYELIVENTGNTSLTFSDFTDPRCDAGTISGGPGTSRLAPGASTTYTCDHVLTAADKRNGSYSNVATDTGTPPGGAPLTVASNTVTVNIPSQVVGAACVASPVKLTGVIGAVRHSLAAHLTGLGVKSVTFYLDSRRFKTVNRTKNNRFSVTINANRLSYGSHRLTARAKMRDSNCANVSRSGVFVHVKSATVLPVFTG